MNVAPVHLELLDAITAREAYRARADALWDALRLFRESPRAAAAIEELADNAEAKLHEQKEEVRRLMVESGQFGIPKQAWG